MKSNGIRKMPMIRKIGSRLSPNGQALLDLLVAHIRKPGVNAQRPETLISYSEALELLGLPEDAPRGPTDGRTLQLNGLNDLAQWVNRQPKMPRITGVIISRSGHDGIDGVRRPQNVPGAGFFKEYKRKTEDWPWWIKQVEASIAFDWSPYVAHGGSYSAAEIRLAGTIAEGSKNQVTSQTRERSARLRDLARAHFATQSPDHRLHCAVCNWAPPASLAFSGPIVEIHHEICMSSLPAEGRSLPLSEAIEFLRPLCPNCHRMLHAKPGGGLFTLDELKRGMDSPLNTGP